MKLSDADLAAVKDALAESCAGGDFHRWPDGLLLQLLQVDALMRISEHLAGIHEAIKRGVVLAGDVLDLIEKSLPTAPHVPDEEEAAEAEWQTQLNRKLEHASIVSLVVDPDHYA